MFINKNCYLAYCKQRIMEIAYSYTTIESIRELCGKTVLKGRKGAEKMITKYET